MGRTVSNTTGRASWRNWYYWLGGQLRAVEVTPLRITLIYVFFGAVALFVSDVLFVQYLSEPLLSRVQAVKGGVEILLTAGLIYGLTSRGQSQLQNTAEELERRRDELQLFHRVFRHNLRNDLNVIIGAAELACNDEECERCERIIDAAEDILEYTRQAKRIRQVTQHDEPATLDLSEAVPRTLGSHEQVTDDVTVRTEIPESAEVRVNPLFEDAVDEVVANAIEHNDATSPEVAVEVDPADGPPQMTTLRIRDNGSGIPEVERESVDAEEASQLHHSTGMGLWFVDWVVTHSGGDLSIVDVDGGTEVRIQLPKTRQSPLEDVT